MNDSVWSNSSVTLSAPHCLAPQYVASGPNLSVSFSSEVFRLEKDEGLLFQTHALVIAGRVNTAEKELVVGFVTDIMLDFGKSAGTRIAILADVSGTNDAVEFGFDPPKTPDHSNLISVHRFFSVQGLNTAGAGIIGSAGPVVPYRMALLLTIQRQSLQDTGHLVLTSVEVFPIIQSA